jgi:hypothetical protein
VSTPEPGVFAEDWVTAWYRHDVDAVLTHFHDDVVFTSPVAARVMPHSKGVVRGKADLREYWCAALNTMPDLHFEIVGIYRGESVLVINYRKPERRLGERTAGVRRRSGASRARDLPIAQLANRCDPGGDIGMHDLGAAAVGHRDRHDELDTLGDVGEIRHVELSPCPQ